MPQKEATGFARMAAGGVPTKLSKSRQFRGNFASEGGTLSEIRTRGSKKYLSAQNSCAPRLPTAEAARWEIRFDGQERFGLAELQLFLPSCNR